MSGGKPRKLPENPKFYCKIGEADPDLVPDFQCGKSAARHFPAEPPDPRIEAPAQSVTWAGARRVKGYQNLQEQEYPPVAFMPMGGSPIWGALHV
jgi:hypothetical protein